MSLHRHWVEKRVGVDCVVSTYLDEEGRAAFPALREIPAEVKDSLVRWSPDPRGGPNDPAPEVILGRPLRTSGVLWTKSAPRLYRDGGRC